MDRRIMLGGGSGSLPASLSPLAWYYASAAYIATNGTTVSQWRDRSGNGNHVSQATASSQPNWDLTTWGGGKPSLQFTGGNSLVATTGNILSSVAGTDIPFALFLTIRVVVGADCSFASWDNSSGNAVILARMDNAGNVLRFTRTDDTGASVTPLGVTAITIGANLRAAYIFVGTTITTYVNSSLDMNGSAANVGLITLNRFRIGDGPGAVNSLQGNVTEVVVLPRQASAAEWAAYYAYSLAEWG